MDPESASAAAELLMDSGAPMKVIDMQIPGAIIWALAGLVLVAVLEYLSTLHKLKESSSENA